MTDNELLSVATRLYVRMRAGGGRVIDALWMTQNELYAREVLRLALMSPDAEVQRLGQRFEEIMFGGGARPAAAASVAAAPSATTAAPVINRFVGVLR